MEVNIDPHIYVMANRYSSIYYRDENMIVSLMYTVRFTPPIG